MDIKREIFNPDSEHKVLLAMFCGAEQIMIPEMARWREGSQNIESLKLEGFERTLIEK